jgi:uncharacterized membrane protein
MRSALEKSVRTWQPAKSWLQIVLITLLALGIFCRFVNLNDKVYWGDETLSSSRIAGFSNDEVNDRIYTGKPIPVSEVLQYQSPHPERNVLDTVRVIATEAPQHPPLYYILSRFWEQALGSSVGIKRSFTAWISLLAFPGIYWLCRELFQQHGLSSEIGWMAIALVALAPIHLLYAQEVRGYSLWTVATIFSSAALLRAMRVKTTQSWVIYAVSLTISLYAFLFGVLVAIAHAVYVVMINRLRWTPEVRAFCLAAIGGILLFTPWIVTFQLNQLEASEGWAWVTSWQNPDIFFRAWATNFLYGFFDMQFFPDDPFTQPKVYLFPVYLALVSYATYYVCCHTSPRIWLFIILLMASTAVPLALPDLVSGGLRSTIPRYQIPSYLGMQLAVAYLFTAKLHPLLTPQRQRRIWQGLFAWVVTGAILSCAQIASSQTWWSKYTDYPNVEIASIINQSSHPLLLSDSRRSRVLSISHLLHPTTQLQLVPRRGKDRFIPEDSLPEIAVDQYSDVFLLEIAPPKPLLRHELREHKGYKFEQVFKNEINFYEIRRTILWRLLR